MKKSGKKGLYFTAEAVPTAAEAAEAEALGLTAFRNASLIFEGTGLEPAELVAGKVPAGYLQVRGQKVAKSEVHKSTTK